MTTATQTEIVDADGWDGVIDKAAQFHLGISGEEFIRRLDSGAYDDPDDGPAGLMAVLTLVLR